MQQEAKSPKLPPTIPTGSALNEELVVYYLYNKVIGQPPPGGLAVEEYNTYGGNEPWEIWETHGGPNLKKDEDLYFFTELKRKGVNDSRFVRKIGLNGGAWKAENSAKIIQDGRTKRSIGIRKRFRYENSRSKHNGCWFMYEYSLHQSLLGHNAHVDDYVICRIQRKDGKRESENVENRVVMANRESPEIALIEDEQSLSRTQGGLSETVGEAKESTKIVPKRGDVRRQLNIVKLDTRREVLGSQQPPLASALLPKSTSQGSPVINIGIEGNLMPESALRAMNGDQPLQCGELDEGSYTDWAVCFAEDLLQNQPVEGLEEDEIEMVPNMLYAEKWLDWEQLN